MWAVLIFAIRALLIGAGVTRDGNRHKVIDHGDPDSLREDAEILAQFLDRPLWEATIE